MPGWRLLSAEAANAAAPDSFFIPPRAKRDALCEGARVKLLFEGETARGDVAVERMWVAVTSAAAGDYSGELLSTPSEIDSISTGHPVSFSSEHVAAYAWSPAELGYDAGAFAWTRIESSTPSGSRPVRASMRPPESLADDGDSGWTLGRGDETGPELSDEETFRWVDLGWLTDLFPDLEPVFRAGAGDWLWDESMQQYVRAD